jgi:ABC-type transport system substrate-binding protein
VRRAIAHAIDRPALLADTPGVDQAVERGGAIPPVMPGHGDTVAVPYDVERARALLAEAGYPDGDGLPEIVVAAPATSPSATLVRQLAVIGMRTRVVTPERWHLVPADVHVFLATWHADYPDPDGFYLGFLELHLPLYRDDETDAVLAGARASRDRDERLRLYREFERLWIGQRVALVPLSYARQLLLYRPHVTCLRLNPMRVFHLEQVVVDPPAAGGQES